MIVQYLAIHSISLLETRRRPIEFHALMRVIQHIIQVQQMPSHKESMGCKHEIADNAPLQEVRSSLVTTHPISCIATCTLKLLAQSFELCQNTWCGGELDLVTYEPLQSVWWLAHPAARAHDGTVQKPNICKYVNY